MRRRLYGRAGLRDRSQKGLDSGGDGSVVYARTLKWSGSVPDAHQLARVFKALSVETRVRIVQLLKQQPLCVNALARRLGVTAAAVSQHLRVLREARLVRERRVGTRRVYRVDPQGLAELRRYLDRFWDDVLLAFQRGAESPGDNEGDNDDR